MNALIKPEVELLTRVLGDPDVAEVLAVAPGGWRTLSGEELERLGLSAHRRQAIAALQKLVRRSYPALPRHQFLCAEDIARVYQKRLAAETTEVIIAVAVNGRNELLAELPVASGGRHGIALTPADVLRPLVRCAASAFVLVHNHPSGDPTPSAEDRLMTAALAGVADAVGIPLLDHVVVAGRDGGWASVLDITPRNPEKEDEKRTE